MIIHTHQKEYPELEFKEENPPAILRKKDGSLWEVQGKGRKKRFKLIRAPNEEAVQDTN